MVLLLVARIYDYRYSFPVIQLYAKQGVEVKIEKRRLQMVAYY